jgi:hypothetical protein
MTDEDTLPEEDELMDRCLEFTNLITQRSMKSERDALFHFIVITTGSRAEFELKRDSYTKYPVLYEIAPEEQLDEQNATYSIEQERFVNKVLEALRDKKTVTLAGSRFA